MADQPNKPYEFYIPDNYMEAGRIFGFRKRNMIEAGVVSLLILRIVFWIPFVMKVKLIVSIVLIVAIGGLFIGGVHNRSVTEWLQDYIRYKRNGKKYHMRLPGVASKDNINLYDDEGRRLSYADVLMKQPQSRLNDETRSSIDEFTTRIKKRLQQ